MNVNDKPLFNMGSVLKETGLSADTLRAWERRYGLPAPTRTQGGHRLYSQRDIELIKWLQARQTEGLSISRAVQLWKAQVAAGRDPLLAEAQQGSDVPHTTLISLREAWLKACIEFDEARADTILNQALLTHNVENVCQHILLQGLQETGEQWYRGAWLAQQEHFISALATRRVANLISAVPPATRTRTLIVAGVPGEQHSFPMLVLTLLLRRRGWPVIYLGPDTPLDTMEQTVERVAPWLVLLTAQTSITTASLQAMARQLKALGIPVAFGGRIFSLYPRLVQRIPGYFLGHSLEGAPDVIETLDRPALPIPDETPVPEELVALSTLYEKQRLVIELKLRETLQVNTFERPVEESLFFIGQFLSAALRLGDLAHLSHELVWLSGLLSHRRIPWSQQVAILEAYAEIIRQVLGDAGQPVQACLTQTLEGLQSQTAVVEAWG